MGAGWINRDADTAPDVVGVLAVGAGGGGLESSRSGGDDGGHDRDENGDRLHVRGRVDRWMLFVLLCVSELFLLWVVCRSTMCKRKGTRGS